LLAPDKNNTPALAECESSLALFAHTARAKKAAAKNSLYGTALMRVIVIEAHIVQTVCKLASRLPKPADDRKKSSCHAIPQRK